MQIDRRRFIQYGSIALSTGLIAACGSGNRTQTTQSPTPAASPNAGVDKVTFGTNWLLRHWHESAIQDEW